jgi:hypothetical protein
MITTAFKERLYHLYQVKLAKIFPTNKKIIHSTKDSVTYCEILILNFAISSEVLFNYGIKSGKENKHVLFAQARQCHRMRKKSQSGDI